MSLFSAVQKDPATAGGVAAFPAPLCRHSGTMPERAGERPESGIESRRTILEQGNGNRVRGRLTITDLRNLVEARYPQAMGAGRLPDKHNVLPTRIPGLDEPMGGGVPRDGLTELVAASPSSGSQLLLIRLLKALRQEQGMVALVDGADSFDPDSTEEDLMTHLLWVRCAQVRQVLQAADLLVRDSNFALVIMDLRWSAGSEVRRINATVWYRLQRVVTHSEVALLVLSPRPLVPSARFRFQLTRAFPMAALQADQAALTEELAVHWLRRRNGYGDAGTLAGEAAEAAV